MNLPSTGQPARSPDVHLLSAGTGGARSNSSSTPRHPPGGLTSPGSVRVLAPTVSRVTHTLLLAGLVVPSLAASSSAPRYHPPEPFFEMQDDSVREVSGLVASSGQPGVWFTHNDSPSDETLPAPIDGTPKPYLPAFYAVDGTGELLATYRLPAGLNVDWEDIARGPMPCPTAGVPGQVPSRCESATAIWVVDLGDNYRTRPAITAYVVPEPQVDPTARGVVVDLTPADHTTVAFTYPQGAQDAESFLVDPATGRAAVITKTQLDDGVADVYVAPHELAPFPQPNPMALVATLRFTAPEGVEDPRGSYGKPTGADWSPDGSRIAVTTYADVYEWDVVDGSLSRTFAAAPALRMTLPPAAAMPQVEAIAYTADGRGLVVGSELFHDADGTPHVPVWVYRGR